MRSSALILLLACSAARADVLEGQVTTLLSGRSDPRDGNIYTVVPIYQALHATLRDVNVGRATGWVDDLRLEVSVWGGGLVGEPIGGQQAIGDVDVGYLEARLLRRRVSLRLGRQVVVGGAARFSHIDGAMLGVQLFRGLELQVWGGVPAIPRFGVRPGEAAAGARLLYRFGFSNQIGLSFAHLQDLGRAARQDIALDFLAQPHRTVSLSGLGVLSLLELRLVEADVGITWLPLRILDVRVDWRRQSPDLFIPRSSIFSVFSQETRDEFGAQLSLRPDGRVDLNADYHTIIDPTGVGYRAALRGALRLGPLHQMTVGAQLRLLKLPTNGYYQARLFALWRLGHGLSASVDADAYLFDQPVNGESFSFVGAASLGWDFKPAWRILVSGAANTTPFQIGGWEAIAKLAYNPVFRFREGGKVKRMAIIALLAGGCATLWLGAPLISGGDQIKAPHARHASAKVDCLTCHEAAYDSKQLGDKISAPEKVCLQCHKDKKDDCAMCHTKVRARTTSEPREPWLKMSHAAHVERTKEDCRVCHKTLPDPVRTQAHVPTMESCLGCHEHKRDFEEGRCNTCHTDLARYALKPVTRFTHGGNYVSEHMRQARSAPQTCATCHEQTFCTDCHAQTVGLRVETKFPDCVDRDFIHRNDFVSRHAIDSHADPASCRKCHGQSFCDDCHKAQALTPQAQGARNPHPLGWSLPGSPQFHGPEARRNIASCAACHDQGAASNCVQCHRSGGIGGNPHPDGWTDRHPREEISRNGMCRACH